MDFTKDEEGLFAAEGTRVDGDGGSEVIDGGEESAKFFGDGGVGLEVFGDEAELTF